MISDIHLDIELKIDSKLIEKKIEKLGADNLHCKRKLIKIIVSKNKNKYKKN